MRLAFGVATDGRFIVKADQKTEITCGVREMPVTTTYADEEAFLERLLSAELPIPVVTQLITAIIQAVKTRAPISDWIQADLNPLQLHILGLGDMDSGWT